MTRIEFADAILSPVVSTRWLQQYHDILDRAGNRGLVENWGQAELFRLPDGSLQLVATLGEAIQFVFRAEPSEWQQLSCN